MFFIFKYSRSPDQKKGVLLKTETVGTRFQDYTRELLTKKLKLLVNKGFASKGTLVVFSIVYFTID